MAGVGFQLTTDRIATGTGGSAKTLLQLVAPANQRVKVKRVVFTFGGVDSTQPPIEVNLLVQTTAGTMSALTPTKEPPDADETIQTTAQHTATAEPTAGTVRRTRLVSPVAAYEFFFGEKGLPVLGGTRLGFRVTNDGTDCDCVVDADCEE